MKETTGITSDLLPRLGSALGAGLSHEGEVCGIVSGALMVIGLQFGRRQAGDSNDFTYYYGAEFIDRFRALKGTIKCRDLTGADFNTPEGQQLWQTNLQDEICSPLLVQAVEIINDLLAE